MTGPKGCYPAGAVTRKPLFQMFAEQIGGVVEAVGPDCALVHHDEPAEP
jgi:hypothetical protein